MPALQVRDLPQETYDLLVESARRDHRSIAQQTTAILQEHFRVLEGGRANPSSPAGRSQEAPSMAQRADLRFLRLANELGLDPSTFVPATTDDFEDALEEEAWERCRDRGIL